MYIINVRALREDVGLDGDAAVLVVEVMFLARDMGLDRRHGA